MALPSVNDMRDELLELLIDELDSAIGDDFDEDTARTNLKPVAKAVAQWVTNLVNDSIKVKTGIHVDSGTFETDEQGDLE